MEANRGHLFVVATPLGNLQDITFRALETLKKVDLIAAEDTRRTRKLLTSYGIRGQLISCHEHNETDRAKLILEKIETGKDVALVTDAGTPGVSDPGARLVSALRAKGVDILPVPGPSAVACALSVCGMKADSYHFSGFLPSKKKERKRAIEKVANLEELLVFFEAPHRIISTLSDMIEVLGDRRAFLAREMTKAHETYLYGNLTSILTKLKGHDRVKGEIVFVVEGYVEEQGKKDAVPKEIDELLRSLLSGRPLGVKEASDVLSKATGIKKGKIYKLALKIKEESNHQ